MKSSSRSTRPAGEWQKLLQEILGKEEGAAAAASLDCEEVVINLDGSEYLQGTQKSDAANEVVIIEKPDPVLHIVAASGDSKCHLECARMIYCKAMHLLTTAAPNSNGDTPLHCAARAGNSNMMAYLINLVKEDGGVDGHDKARDLVRMQNKLGETALHEAVRFGDVKMVEALMNADKGLASVDANDGTSPMYLASTLGHKEMAFKLHNVGDEPSYSGPHGQNALHAAVLHNNTGITALLLKWKNDLVKQRDTDGSTPLHFAASAKDPFNQFTVSVFSMNFSVSYTGIMFYFLPLKVFEWWGRPAIQLMEADPTCAFQRDSHGSFPVHIAASAGCMVFLFVLLIRYPTCARLRNGEGKTFLHVAVEKKRLIMVKFLRFLWGGKPLFKSIVNVRDHNGDTALHLAVREGDMDMCRLLIGIKDTDINLENTQRKTPMDLAAGAVKSGFYFGLTAPRRILSILSFANAQAGNRRRDLVPEYSPRLEDRDEDKESQKIKDLAQIVGIGSVLVATATFTAALTMPGGVWSPGDSAGKKPAGTPVLAGSYAFDGFVISNTVAFICSTLATFSLVYCGVAAVDIRQRIRLVTFSLALLLCSARSFCAALAFSLYMLLANVAHGTAIASIVMTSLALLDGVTFLLASLRDLLAILPRRSILCLRLYDFLFLNILYPFWPYLVIGGYLLYDVRSGGKLHSPSRH